MFLKIKLGQCTTELGHCGLPASGCEEIGNRTEEIGNRTIENTVIKDRNTGKYGRWICRDASCEPWPARSGAYGLPE